MSIPHIEAERTRVNLVKHFRPIGPAGIVAAVAAKNSSLTPLRRGAENQPDPRHSPLLESPSVKTKIS